MRALLLLSLLTLGACASTPPPEPDPQQAWVTLATEPGDSLTAHELDGTRLSDGRYFQVPAGEHSLQVRYRFERTVAGNPMSMEATEITCFLRVRYTGFAAGQRYRFEARPLAAKAQGWLYDEQRQAVARADVLRCGPY